MTLAGPPAPGQYAAFEPLTDFIVGPHCLFERNGIVFNDRSLLETYWVEEMTGFDTPARNVTSTQNVQQHGALPETSFYGERTMTLTGWVQAGSYPQVMRMAKRMMDSMVSLVEKPMRIFTQAEGIFRQPSVVIGAKPSDVNVSKKIEAADMTGVFKAQFAISFRASDPVYVEETIQSAVLVPTTITARGRTYDRYYDRQYNVPMDSDQNPVAVSGNSIVIQNTGNWIAQPKITFTGPSSRATLFNEETDQYIFVKPLAAGQSISMNVYTGEIIDQDGFNAARMIETASDWMWFNGIYDEHDGSSRISYFVDSFGTGAKVEFTWKAAHI